MGRARVRLQDIADATGYSMNTVSLALRDSPRIGALTRALILKEAERLNYFPNRIARSLVSQASNTVGLIMTDIMNPTQTLAARTIERKLSLAGYGMLFAASDCHLDNEKKALQWFQSYQVDGILIYPADRTSLDHLKSVRASGIPMILLASLPDAGLDVVSVDNRIGACRAIDHLLSKGHRRIAIIDGGNAINNTEKLMGAKQAIADAGLCDEVLSLIIPEGNTAAQGYQAMDQVSRLDPKVTAVFTSTDSLAIGALRWCQTHDIAVPDELAVMGYDNTEAAEFSSPPLSTVHYAADEVSNIAVDRMIELIKTGDTDSEPAIERIRPGLVIRSTT